MNKMTSLLARSSPYRRACILGRGLSRVKTYIAILLIMIGLTMAMFFAYFAPLYCRSMKINSLMVEAAGVERFFHRVSH